MLLTATFLTEMLNKAVLRTVMPRNRRKVNELNSFTIIQQNPVWESNI